MSIKRGLVLALALGLAGASALAAEPDPLYVNLNDFPLFVRLGFDGSSLDAEPGSGPEWKVLPATGRQGRYARPLDLGLEGVPKRAPFSLASHPEQTFTYAIPFDFPRSASILLARHRPAEGSVSGIVDAPPVPGIHFAALGDNWEVFLNGRRVAAELHPDDTGRIQGHRSLRDVHFPVDPALLRPGRNHLVVRILADPTFPPAGLSQAEPYYIGSYSEIERANAELLPVLLCGLYLFIGLYHLFMFAVRPVDRHNLYYGLFSVDLAIYLFVRTHTAALLVPDSDTIFRIELASLSLILPFLGAFIETLCDDRVKLPTWIFGGFCAVLAVLQILMPAAFAHDLLRVWQFVGMAAAAYYFGHSILGRFIRDGRRRWKRGPEAARPSGLAREYLTALARTPIGNLLVGAVILFGTAIYDILDSIYMQTDLVLTQYGFFVFTMGTALILANRFGFLHERLKGLNADLEERIRLLTETGENLAASERKYRSLFQGSTDPLALVDENLAFIEGNGPAVSLFGLDRAGKAGRNLEDALYVEEREGRLQAERLRRAVEAQVPGGAAEELSVKLRTPLGEPKPCRLRVEHVASPAGGRILLRVLPEARDPLAEYFVEARERYDIENTLLTAEDLCRKACLHLPRYLAEEDAGFLEICLREVVVNAIEHGNLEVSFDEKTANQKSGRYFDFLLKRRLEPGFRDRRVVLEYSISAERATFRVTDGGKGFDHRAFLRKGTEAPEELFEHGRGLLMTLSAFDRVLYNEKGNQVTLVKYFRSPGEAGKA